LVPGLRHRVTATQLPRVVRQPNLTLFGEPRLSHFVPPVGVPFAIFVDIFWFGLQRPVGRDVGKIEKKGLLGGESFVNKL
jgi:hypothetical protein